MFDPVQKTQNLFNSFAKFIQYDLWQKDFSHISRLRAAVYEEIKLIYLVFHSFLHDRSPIRASALVYSTLLGIAPLIAVAFSLFKGFGFHLRLEPALLKWAEPFGARSQEMIRQMITELDKTNLSAFGTAGMTFLLFSFLSIVTNIERAFNDIWRITHDRPLFRKFADYLVALFFIPVLLIGLPAFNAAIQTIPILSLIRHFPGLEWLLNKATPFFVVWLIFSFLYLFIPNTAVHFKSAVIGAFYAAVLWQASNFYFTRFLIQAYYTGIRAALFTGLAGFMLFLAWLYIGWIVVLLGAEISYVHQNEARVHSEIKKIKYCYALRERLALQVLLYIAERLYRGEEAADRNDICTRFHIPERLAIKILDTLLKLRLIYEIPSPSLNSRYTLARCPQHIRINDLLKGLRAQGEEMSAEEQTLYHQTVAAIQKKFENLIDKSFSSLTVQDLLRQATETQTA
ncbi:MAG: YihY/virulence factor BrkB family protein [candidate division KSB1 bacterium]|nr:YihY/virulence factor BrkB family protein [candidate division KSB1 bacterium]